MLCVQYWIYYKIIGSICSNLWSANPPWSQISRACPRRAKSFSLRFHRLIWSPAILSNEHLFSSPGLENRIAPPATPGRRVQLHLARVSKKSIHHLADRNCAARHTNFASNLLPYRTKLVDCWIRIPKVAWCILASGTNTTHTFTAYSILLVPPFCWEIHRTFPPASFRHLVCVSHSLVHIYLELISCV